MKGKISIVVPCYNEEKNIYLLYETVTRILENELSEYDYEILILDNKSKDNTREIIRSICKNDNHVRAIFHRINCGSNANALYGLQNSDGDCTIMLYADFQEPPELIPKMVHEWEKEHKNICMVKTSSKENKLVYWARDVYYKIFKKMSDVSQIHQFDGFGCYDKSFVNVAKKIVDCDPYFKGVVAEYASDIIKMEYEQQKRAAGVSSLNFWGYYDSAMLSFTSYTKWGLRIATVLGFLIATFSFVIALIYSLMKIVNWNGFEAGNIPILVGVFFLGGCQMIFIGFLGEYIMNINKRVINRPMAIEEERVNF